MKKIPFLLTILLFTTLTVAQEACSALVESALESVDRDCEALDRNEMCYGNQAVLVTLYDDAEIDFDQPGDIASILDVESLRLSAMIEPDEWGVAVMKVQANLPDTIPGQNVTFLLFGDVQVQNATQESTPIAALTTGNINVRSGPGTNTAIKASLAGNTALELLGRNEAGDWVYFKTEEGQEGWLFASLLSVEGGTSTLEVVPNTYSAESQYGAMQAVYVETGITDSQCREAPDSGILIQTPDGASSVELVINDVEVQLGSTAYVKSERNHAVWFYVLEGQAIITAEEETQIVPQGAFVWVPIDEDLRASGAPVDVMAYSLDDLGALPLFEAPVTVEVTEAISVAEPASDEAIESAIQRASGNGFVGTWTSTDVDGSSQVLTLAPIDDRTLQLYLFDDGARSCDVNRTLIYSGEVTGVGTRQGNTLSATVDLVCGNPESTVISNVPVTYTYDRSSDTITDSSGVIWSRQ